MRGEPPSFAVVNGLAGIFRILSRRGGLTKSGTGWPSGVGDSQQAAWQWRSLPSQVLPPGWSISSLGRGGRALRNRNEAFRVPKNQSKGYFCCDFGSKPGDSSTAERERTHAARYHYGRPASRSGKHELVDQLIIFLIKRIYKGYAAQHETILEILGQQIRDTCTLSRSP